MSVVKINACNTYNIMDALSEMIAQLYEVISRM